MQNLLIFFPENVMSAMGWTLLHSLWQIVVIAILLKGVFYYKKQSAHAKYWSGIGSLVLQSLLSVLTYFLVFENHSTISTYESSQILAALKPSTSNQVQSVANDTFSFWTVLTNFLSANLSIFVKVWVLGILVLSVRLMGGYFYTEQLRWKHTKVIKGNTLATFEALLEKININKGVNLLESSLASSPMTIGFLQPVILLPVGLLTGLSNIELEAILAHELAHIKRHDYLVNIIQSLVEIIFFFHPAIWWISSRIREERENCCDDLAVQLCGSNIHLAKALTKVEIFQQQPISTLAMGFAGKKQSLLGRIQRILGVQKANSVNHAGIILTGMLVLMSVLVLSLPTADAQTVPAPPKPPKRPAPPKAHKNVTHTFSGNDMQIHNGQVFVNGVKIPLSENDSIALSKELKAIDELQEQMKPHQEEMESLSKQMNEFSVKMESESKPMSVFSDKMSKLGTELGKLGEKQATLATRMIHLKEGSQAMKDAQLQSEQIEKQMNELSRQMEVEGKKMDEVGRRMDLNAAPMDSLGRLMDKAAKPMEAIGKEIEKHALAIEKILPEQAKVSRKSRRSRISPADAPEPPSPATPPAPPAAPKAPSKLD
ncbi:M56 family metallopeptidase [Arcicella rigui]|uniref:M56 family metallopeptidase n=1 Tax=Arcicella rigui TaxID=797020 RepID=A0ABU5Q6C9_9BACT|nr:M56 family metallopeptidase [Arcicella rigui]MEA5138112.1 M56 family metallopeptidase [Arcicella rigui]